MVRVEGTIKRIICTKNSSSPCPWIIAEVEQADGETTTIKGNVSCNAEVNDYLRGEFDLKDSMYGQQYETKSVVEILPPRGFTAVMARLTELAHSVKIRMTGPFKAHIAGLLENEDVWKALDESTDSVLFDLQIKAEEYNKRYESGFVSSMDVEAYLKDLGLSWTSKKIRQALGYEEDCEEPERKPIKKDELIDEPFMLLELPGISTTDVMEYLACLINLKRINEQTLQIGMLIKNLLEEEGKQNTCMSTPSGIEIHKQHPAFAKYIVQYNNYIYRKTTFLKEQNVSIFVAERISAYSLDVLQSDTLEEDLAKLPPDDGKIPTEDQRTAIAQIFKEPLSMILGGAGTGKTTALRLLCRYSKVHMPLKIQNVMFLAPTGKAVQRIRQSIANLDFCNSVYSRTIHGFVYSIMASIRHICDAKCHASKDGCALKVPPWAETEKMRKKRTPALTDGSSPTIPYCDIEIIVIDEAFMVDLSILSMFVTALRLRFTDPKTFPHIVFIGDDAQLLPVSYGQPILDFERSGIVPIHRLQQIHRHADKSVLLNAINALRNREIHNDMDATYSIVPVTDKTMKMVLLEWIDAHPDSPRGDETAIIVPTNELLNLITPIVREYLNPVSVNPPIMIGPFEFKFRIGDKVMQIKNNPKRDAFNGTCGRIVKFVERKREVLRANGKIERVPTYTVHVLFNDRNYDVLYEIEDAKKELNLAYAFTTHKAQGSEYEHVLIIMTRPIPGFINRNLIYTGASRGKRSVTIALTSMNIRKGWRDLPAERRTNLVAMIDEKVDYEEEPTP